ncbi:hypothetical protein [Aquimarina sp. 2201CG14-23]|uniref:hypothetical protein n=1 Tax=Aquimarina mycalae TaxID=3040073 RepID=UPI0024781EF9|nr:hypothetical protein [Aquimarina sp. 2201CG14-23]MDH7445027.1 hypothetical protein [Aquimarina sp. 2201CG14-23]
MEVFLYSGKIDKSSGKRNIPRTLVLTHLCIVNVKQYKMNTKNKSIFNLIEIFRQGKQRISRAINAKAHCDQRSHHDFYCDAERPFIQDQK